MTWRDEAKPIIARVISETGTADRKALRRALLAAYPWGDRKYHPYKIWCHEIRVQLGEVDQRRCRVRSVKSSEGQLDLFG